ncbi:MAG TPA: hypothetical protein VFE57_06530 [Cyclobacteriaceae bacterium]|nr:hypothetical protein [Cyclobacteriaceae bacterium]
MRKYLELFVIFIVVVTSHHALGQLKSEIERLENASKKQPTQFSHYQDLDALLNAQYEKLTKDDRTRIRTILNNTNFSTINTYSSVERGSRIVIKGKVVDKNQSPIAGARIITFQTDASGSYAPSDSITKRMSEPDSRLYGALRTDQHGNFEIHTVRPGAYPMKYEGRFIPQHVHVNVSVQGFQPVALQMVFDDDPALKDNYWREWAKGLGFPVLKLVPVNGVQTATHIIILQEK